MPGFVYLIILFPMINFFNIAVINCVSNNIIRIRSLKFRAEKIILNFRVPLEVWLSMKLLM